MGIIPWKYSDRYSNFSYWAYLEISSLARVISSINNFACFNFRHKFFVIMTYWFRLLMLPKAHTLTYLFLILFLLLPVQYVSQGGSCSCDTSTRYYSRTDIILCLFRLESWYNDILQDSSVISLHQVLLSRQVIFTEIFSWSQNE